MPRCAAGARLTSACYDPYAEYGRGMLDVPHRVILAPIVELPFGQNRKWANASKAADWVIGGWSISAIVNLQSGFPMNVQQTDNTNLLGGAQRPNLSGQNLATLGNYEDRLASADHRPGTSTPAENLGMDPYRPCAGGRHRAACRDGLFFLEGLAEPNVLLCNHS